MGEQPPTMPVEPEDTAPRRVGGATSRRMSSKDCTDALVSRAATAIGKGPFWDTWLYTPLRPIKAMGSDAGPSEGSTAALGRQ